jgi:hypothetical protein
MRSHRLSPFYATLLTAGLVDTTLLQVDTCTGIAIDGTPTSCHTLLSTPVTDTSRTVQKETVSEV